MSLWPTQVTRALHCHSATTKWWLRTPGQVGKIDWFLHFKYTNTEFSLWFHVLKIEFYLVLLYSFLKWSMSTLDCWCYHKEANWKLQREAPLFVMNCIMIVVSSTRHWTPGHHSIGHIWSTYTLPMILTHDYCIRDTSYMYSSLFIVLFLIFIWKVASCFIPLWWSKNLFQKLYLLSFIVPGQSK